VRRFVRSDADRTAFEHHLRGLQSFVAVREARARWQLVASGAMRAAVRRRGYQLVERGALTTVDDVFLLAPAEYDDPSSIRRSALAERREQHEHWCRVVPPNEIGLAGGTAAAGDGDGVGDELRGQPGSPGLASGRARVILDLVDAERLQVGDVLVTTMTAPPWTPLFGVAAAVVTDAGDNISHVAIAAREYGIPCVVATGSATNRIRDGQVVTVDGSGGVVTLHEGG
jgi:phosphohistidine swiveling domain-containing protein